MALVGLMEIRDKAEITPPPPKPLFALTLLFSNWRTRVRIYHICSSNKIHKLLPSILSHANPFKC